MVATSTLMVTRTIQDDVRVVITNNVFAPVTKQVLQFPLYYTRLRIIASIGAKTKGVVVNHTSEYYSGSLRHREAPRSTPNMLLQTWIFSWYKFCNGNHVIASVVNSTAIGARIVTENSYHHFQEPNEVCFTLQYLASLLSALQVLLQQPDSGALKPSTPHRLLVTLLVLVIVVGGFGAIN
ncbi:transmembrane protein, putative [Medicago truncatula]|uniref:Transmembrane protein, putative n=1 Tax=Medicago truncatula TaxID=3880 RepID=A0A072V6V3_MEDTR|nr:transmembrane protein, putative [Medicago truncatula]